MIIQICLCREQVDSLGPRSTGSSAVGWIETKLRLICWILTYEHIVTSEGLADYVESLHLY